MCFTVIVHKFGVRVLLLWILGLWRCVFGAGPLAEWVCLPVLPARHMLLQSLCDRSGNFISNPLLVPLHAVKIALFTWKCEHQLIKTLSLNRWALFGVLCRTSLLPVLGAVPECDNIRQMQEILRVFNDRGKLYTSGFPLLLNWWWVILTDCFQQLCSFYPLIWTVCKLLHCSFKWAPYTILFK